MRKQHTGLGLSATDLANHLGCSHLTNLNRACADGRLIPPTWRDPMLHVLKERGLEHERAFIEHLRSRGFAPVHLESTEATAQAATRTRDAMHAGHDVIVQATLASNRFLGIADILRRVDLPSNLGPYSYQVIDTKLARETRAGTVLQLCLYSELVAEIQGVAPRHMYVVTPGPDFPTKKYRVNDYLAYFRFVKARLELAVDAPAAAADDATYPEPCPQCDICRWWSHCDQRRRDDDHLSLVAGILRSQRRELRDWGIDTLASLARMTIPIEQHPKRGSRESYEKVREQARLQLAARESQRPVYELLPREPEQGLARLPAPSPGDIFFDIEGDRFYSDGGLEYLLGTVTVAEGGEPHYESLWAWGRRDEKAAFEAFVDGVMARWEQFPDLHIYHFHSYEPSAVKRLMGRHATRELEVDRMLRGQLFVDLHRVVRQSLRAGVEKYSIKDLEVFYDFEREAELREASAHLRALECALEVGDPQAVDPATREIVEAYNRDDCVSTLRLRDWLEGLRAGLVAEGEVIARPAPESGDPSEALGERQARVRELMEALAGDVSAERAERSPGEHARWLLAHMLEWHWREMKTSFWEKYRLLELTEEDLLHDKAGLAGLERVEGDFGGTERCPVHRYRFPPQECTLRGREEVYVGEVKIGTMEGLDVGAGTVDVKKTQKTRDEHPTAVFGHTLVRNGVLAKSLLRMAEWVVEHGIDAEGEYRAGRDMLLRRPPRLREGADWSVLGGDEGDVGPVARAAVLEVDGGVLPVQGPPGSGKTYTGARMICDLVRAGKRVGVTAVSHKVIRNLPDGVMEAARQEGVDVRCVQKPRKKSEVEVPGIVETTKNDAVLEALRDGEADVGAATAFEWARESYRGAVDVLFVDEAGQMSLADVLAAAQAARSVVLLGDPQQLEQPQQGSHPEGTEASALEHLLEGAETMPPGRGMFLPETWRLHPDICGFTSEVFYEERLDSKEGLAGQVIAGPTRFAGAGLWFVPVEHEGCQSSCPEEVECVAEIVGDLVADGVTWTDREGVVRPFGLDDVLIVAPYNAQVQAIAAAVPGAHVGTVDRFQGQEAPVVIYSMTTSSPDDAPRGMEFLYSMNRLNVATSRARCACILVANPELFQPECRTVRQMRLANGFCRYLELARTIKAVTSAPLDHDS